MSRTRRFRSAPRFATALLEAFYCLDLSDLVRSDIEETRETLAPV